MGDGRYVVNAGWDDVPHIDEATKKRLLAETPPYLRDARSKGIASMGAGAIYPVPEAEFVIPPVKIPDWFTRGYALEVGWNRTAALFGAYDRDEDILYLTGEHYRGQAEPTIHAKAIKARAGDWMPGFIDPASHASGQADGQKLFELYQGEGLKLTNAINAVEAGILAVWDRISTGRLKVFSTLTHWLEEFRYYRRDERGKIVKEDDHLMDDTRYLVQSIAKMVCRPTPKIERRAVIAGDAVAGY